MPSDFNHPDTLQELVAQWLRQRQARLAQPGSASPAVDCVPLGGGSVTELVAQVRLSEDVVLKASNDDQVIEQQQLVARWAGDDRLPLAFRDAQPWVEQVAGRKAYMMQAFLPSQGWFSLQERLYPVGGRPADGLVTMERCGHAALDILLGTWAATINRRLLPNLHEASVGRVADRMAATARLDDRFGPRALVVNGEPVPPYEALHAACRRHRATLQAWSAPFSAVVHGDLNPGNVLAKVGYDGVAIKLIDPATMGTGDICEDVGRLVSHLEVVCPVQRSAAAPRPWMTVAHRVADDGALHIDLTLDVPMDVLVLTQAIRERAAEFAAVHGDVHFLDRMELLAACHLVGLAFRRLVAKGGPRLDEALAVYAQGMVMLHRLLQRLDRIA